MPKYPNLRFAMPKAVAPQFSMPSTLNRPKNLNTADLGGATAREVGGPRIGVPRIGGRRTRLVVIDRRAVNGRGQVGAATVSEQHRGLGG